MLVASTDDEDEDEDEDEEEHVCPVKGGAATSAASNAAGIESQSVRTSPEVAAVQHGAVAASLDDRCGTSSVDGKISAGALQVLLSILKNILFGHVFLSHIKSLHQYIGRSQT